MIQQKKVKDFFNEEYPDWIIGYCPDGNEFFVTKKRHFFWKSEQCFTSEEEGILFF